MGELNYKKQETIRDAIIKLLEDNPVPARTFAVHNRCLETLVIITALLLGFLGLWPTGSNAGSTTERLGSAPGWHQVADLPGSEALTFSDDSRFLFTAKIPRFLKWWDTTTWQEFNMLVDLGAGWALSADGKVLVASAFESARVQFWSIETQKELRTIETPDCHFYGLALSPDSKTLALNCAEGLQIYSVDSGLKTADLNHEGGTPKFSRDGKLLVSISFDDVKLWDTGTWKMRSCINLPPNVKFPSFDSELKFLGILISGVQLVDLRSGRPIATHSDPITAVAFSPTDKLVVFALNNGLLKIWDTSTKSEIATFSGAPEMISGLTFSPDGKMIAANGDDRTVVWTSDGAAAGR